MPYDGPKTRNGIREALNTRYDKDSRSTKITLSGEVVGQMVTYGKKTTMSVSKTGFRPTVFSGRVNVDGIRLDVEASSAPSVLNGLATQINQALRARNSKDAPRAASEIAADDIQTQSGSTKSLPRP